MTGLLSSLGAIAGALSLNFVVSVVARAEGYNPLVPLSENVKQMDLAVRDSARERNIPIRVYLPAGGGSAPTVFFSHGLGGTRAGSAYLGLHWASRGYVAVFLQHPGSDDSVWKNVPASQRMAALERAASFDNLLLRARDVSAVADQLVSWNADHSSPLFGRCDLRKLGMSGHSFGARTTQVICGETLPGVGNSLADARFKAAVIFSPSAPSHGDASAAFRAVTVPWMLMTGTKDVAPVGPSDMQSRLTVYPALPAGIPKYEVVLYNAQHSAFIERALLWDREPRNPNHHRVILALSTACWDAYLRGDKNALNWLNGSGPRSLMQEPDRWQCSP